MITIKHLSKLSAIIAIAVTFSSCSFNSNSNKNTEVSSQTTSTNQSSQSMQTKSSVEIPSTKEVVNTLCSDEFQGRLTGSKGNEKASKYINNIFKNIGLTPLFQDTYYEKYPQLVSTTSEAYVDIKYTKEKVVNNVIGVIKGRDRKKAVVISAHFDHIGYKDGKIIRGALDNASGMSALIKIANNLKEKSNKKPFDMDIIICAFNGEERGLGGSSAFVKEIKSKSLYYNLYNINIDCIGSKNASKNLALKNKSTVSNKLYDSMKTVFKKDNINFADTAVHGSGDHMAFEYAGIPNVFIVQENIEKLVHKPSDIPNDLDFSQIDKIANGICDFIETNNGIVFQSK